MLLQSFKKDEILAILDNITETCHMLSRVNKQQVLVVKERFSEVCETTVFNVDFPQIPSVCTNGRLKAIMKSQITEYMNPHQQALDVS